MVNLIGIPMSYHACPVADADIKYNALEKVHSHWDCGFAPPHVTNAERSLQTAALLSVSDA